MNTTTEAPAKTLTISQHIKRVARLQRNADNLASKSKQAREDLVKAKDELKAAKASVNGNGKH